MRRVARASRARRGVCGAGYTRRRPTLARAPEKRHAPNASGRARAPGRAEAVGESERGGFRRAEAREGVGGAKRSRYNVRKGVFGRGASDKAAEVKGRQGRVPFKLCV